MSGAKLHNSVCSTSVRSKISITLRYHGGNCAPPTRPPLAPVRPRPSAEAPGRDRPDSSLPPAPPAGGKITLQNPSTRIAEYCSRVRSRAVLQTARSLITIRSIESWSLLRSVALRSETPALYLAANRKFNTLQNHTHERIDIKTNCRAPQPGRGGPAPPSRPAFVARLALAARLSVL